MVIIVLLTLAVFAWGMYCIAVYKVVKEANRLHSRIADWLGLASELSGKGITINDVAKARDHATETFNGLLIKGFTLKYGSPKCAFLGYKTIFGNNLQWKIKINEDGIEFIPNPYFKEDLV